MPQSKRMTSFNRFKKFIASVYIDRVLTQLHVPPVAKLAASSKACAAAWNEFIVQPILQKYGAQTQADVNKIKKKATAEIDGRVNDLYYSLTRTNENWSETTKTSIRKSVYYRFIKRCRW